MCVPINKSINFVLLIFTFTAIHINKVHTQNDLNGLTACEQEQIARQIFFPKSGHEMHANALRNQLKQIIENYLTSNDGMQYLDDENQPMYDSIDLDALEKHTANILNGKRNVAAMARLASSREGAKRSLATLAKNGQLPIRDYDSDDDYNPYNNNKRNLASIARGTMSGKRNIGSLARDYVLPSSGKRNLPSILRSGSGGSGSTSSSSTHGPQPQPKRSWPHGPQPQHTRENQLPYYQNKNEKRDVAAATSNKYSMEEKRNIGSYKNSQTTSKVKRDAVYESEQYDFPDETDTQAYQPSPYNYNDLNELYSFYGMPDISNEKRFLGRILPPTRATSKTIRRRL